MYVDECAGNREPFLLVDVYVYNTLSRNPLAVCKPADGDHLDERLTISSDDLMWYVVATDHPTEDGVLSVIRVSPTGHEADVTIDMDHTKLEICITLTNLIIEYNGTVQH